MNERMVELIKQLGGIQYNEDGDELTPILVGKDLEKFAELIVRECIAQAVKEEERYDLLGGRDCEYCSMAMSNFQGVLAEHFGVEE